MRQYTYILWAPRGCRMSLVSSWGAAAPQPSSAPLSGWYLMRLLRMLSLISSSRALFMIFSAVVASVMKNLFTRVLPLVFTLARRMFSFSALSAAICRHQHKIQRVMLTLHFSFTRIMPAVKQFISA